MKYALVILEGPLGYKHEQQAAWQRTTEAMRDKTSQSGKVEVLSESCYLCDLSSGLHDLRHIVAVAADFGFQSRTLFFENEPPFVISPKL